MSGNGTFKIGGCLVEPDLDRISRGSAVATVRPQVMDVLVYLALRGGQIVHADELLDNLWSGKVVTSASIYNCINELRSAFQSCDENQPYVETVPKRGYRMVAPVSDLEEQIANEANPPGVLRRMAGRKFEFAIIALLCLVLAFVLVDQYLLPPSVARLGPRSVIILPFSSKQEEQAGVYADGLHSEIQTQLHKIEAVTTVGRVTALHYRGTEKAIELIAEETGVATVMFGSLIMAAGQIRFDAELLDAASGKTLWADSYEFPQSAAGLFRIQSDVATQVANALKAELSPTERQLINESLVISDAAYDHYLRGEGYRQRTRLQDAIGEYEQATRADPNFAAAWARLAMSRALASYTGLAPATMEQAELALEQARQLAPEIFETQMAEAMLLRQSNRFAESSELLYRLLERQPGAVEPLIRLAAISTVMLHLDQARRLAERAVELDPMNIRAAWQLAFIHAWSWNFEDAKTYYDRVYALEQESPHHWRVSMRFGVYFWGLGDSAAARQILESAPATIPTFYHEFQLAYVGRNLQEMQDLLESTAGDPLDRYAAQTRLHRLKGDMGRQRESANLARSAAEEWLERLLGRGAPPVDIEYARSEIAVALALAGNESEAIRTIERAIARAAADPDRLNAVFVYQNEILTYTFLGHTDVAIKRLRTLLSWATPATLTPYRLQMDPDFDTLRDHPEFESLLEELAVGVN